MDKELSVLRSNLEEEHKKQITLIKQVLITVHSFILSLRQGMYLLGFNFLSAPMSSRVGARARESERDGRAGGSAERGTRAAEGRAL